MDDCSLGHEHEALAGFAVVEVFVVDFVDWRFVDLNFVTVELIT